MSDFVQWVNNYNILHWTVLAVVLYLLLKTRRQKKIIEIFGIPETILHAQLARRVREAAQRQRTYEAQLTRVHCAIMDCTMGMQDDKTGAANKEELQRTMDLLTKERDRLRENIQAVNIDGDVAIRELRHPEK